MTDWEDLSRRFEKHFSGAVLSEDELTFKSGSSKFVIKKTGEVKAEMPLHSFRTEEFERIEFEEGRIKVFGDSTVYEFKK